MLLQSWHRIHKSRFWHTLMNSAYLDRRWANCLGSFLLLWFVEPQFFCSPQCVQTHYRDAIIFIFRGRHSDCRVFSENRSCISNSCCEHFKSPWTESWVWRSLKQYVKKKKSKSYWGALVERDHFCWFSLSSGQSFFPPAGPLKRLSERDLQCSSTAEPLWQWKHSKTLQKPYIIPRCCCTFSHLLYNKP